MAAPPVVIVVDPYSSGVLYAPALRRAGFCPVAVLSSPAPAPDFTSTFRPAHFDMRLSAAAGIVRLADQLAGLHPVAVIPGAESGVELADFLAARLTPERSNVPELARARRHKGQMISAARDRGIPVPRTVSARSIEDVERWLAVEQLAGADLIVKPAMSAATDGISLARGGQGWRPAMQRLYGQVNSMGVVNDEIVVQERLIGTEYVVDTFSCEGEHRVTNICQYGKISNGQNVAVYEHVEFLPYDSPGNSALINYVEQVLAALGVRFGSAHAEVMMTAAGPRLVEMNARLAGAGLPRAALLATGQNGVSHLINYLSGTPEMSHQYSLQTCVMTVMFFFPRAGVVSNVEAYDKIRSLGTCRHLRINIRNGQDVPATSDLLSSMRLGWAMLADRDTERVHEDYAKARAIAAEVQVA